MRDCTGITRTTLRVDNERGVALAVAIFAIVIIGMLVTGIFYASYLEQRTGENTLYAQQAFEAAETGMVDVLSNWNQSVYGGFPVDTPQALTAVTAGRSRYTPIVTRLNSNLYMVSARGEQLDAGGTVLSRRMLGTLARLAPATVDVQAAVTSKGNGEGRRHRHGGRQRPHPGRLGRRVPGTWAGEGRGADRRECADPRRWDDARAIRPRIRTTPRSWTRSSATRSKS